MIRFIRLISIRRLMIDSFDDYSIHFHSMIHSFHDDSIHSIGFDD